MILLFYKNTATKSILLLMIICVVKSFPCSSVLMYSMYLLHIGYEIIIFVKL